MTRKPAPSPLEHEAFVAERDGDYARARALSAKLCQDGSGEPRAAHLASHQRMGRLALDPMAWQVGAAALCAYTAAWIYAIAANR